MRPSALHRSNIVSATGVQMNRTTFLAAAIVLLALGAGPAPAEDTQKLVITGASTIAPLAAEIGKRFEKLNKGVRVDVQTGGSARGVNDARSGLAQIGMVSRKLKDDEMDLKAFPIANDGVCMILHKTNPVSVLSTQQIKDIYTGKIRNWKEVGGKDAAITVANKAEGRSTLDLFLGYFELKNSEIKASVIVGDNLQDIKTVSGNPNAIGYVSIGSAEYETESGTPIKLLPLEGVAPTIANVREAKFPLGRPLNLVTKETPTGLVKRFIDFAQSKEVNDLIKEQFFVPLAR
jgi:phosphate transport system substrate-binding protein